MQRLSGVMLLLAGAALGGYAYLPPPQNDAEKLAEVTRISAAPDRDLRAAATAERVFAPAAPQQGVKAAVPAQPPVAAAPVAVAVATPVEVPVQSAQPSATTWTAVVKSEPAEGRKLSSSKPGDAETRAVLARDLQTELSRVGCYEGEINGTWTPSTKRAMSAFMDRVNASLPIEEPDYILLTLVQGHKAAACGADCPTGQLMEAGRCVPQAVFAKATRKQQREEERKVAEAQKAEQQTKQQDRAAGELRAAEQRRIADARRAEDERKALRALEQKRVADAGRAAEAKKLADATRAVAKKKAQQMAQAVAAATPEELPWQKKDQPVAAGSSAALIPPAPVPPAPVPAVRPAPLPGMMAVGAANTAQPELPASVAAVTPDKGPRPELGNADTASTSTDPAVAPPETPAVKPAIKSAAPSLTIAKRSTVQGLPGSKSGVTVRRQASASQKYRAAKIARRPSPRPAVAYYKAPKPKVIYYASNSGGKSYRRAAPRPGSMQYLILQSMGGIY